MAELIPNMQLAEKAFLTNSHKYFLQVSWHLTLYTLLKSLFA